MPLRILPRMLNKVEAVALRDANVVASSESARNTSNPHLVGVADGGQQNDYIVIEPRYSVLHENP